MQIKSFRSYKTKVGLVSKVLPKASFTIILETKNGLPKMNIWYGTEKFANTIVLLFSGSFKASYIHSETGKEEILFFAIEDWWATDLDSFANQEGAALILEGLGFLLALSLAPKMVSILPWSQQGHFDMQAE